MEPLWLLLYPCDVVRFAVSNLRVMNLIIVIKILVHCESLNNEIGFAADTVST